MTQLQLALTDTPIQAVTPAQSRSRSRSSRNTSYATANLTGGRAVVIDCLMKHPAGLTREEIASLTGLKLSTVCARANELLNVEHPRIYVAAESRNKCSVLVYRS
jgi:hypothetical protein